MSSSCCRGAPGASAAYRWLVILGFLTGVMCRDAVAQHGWELGVQGIATFADFDFAGGGGWGAWRPGGSTRIGVSLMPGSIGGEFSARGEMSAQFLLSPAGRGPGLYAGAGLAGLAGARDQGYLMLLLGYEKNPGGGSGWVVEGGIGGGVRVLLGYRWRGLRR
ncbi:MAG: hypothetical protein ABI836_15180 [Gemmatimonadota bacterium]